MKIDDTEFVEQEVLYKVKQTYLNEIAYMGITNGDLTRFCWTQNKHITIYLMKVHCKLSVMGEYPGFLISLAESPEDQIKYYDLYNETYKFNFDQINGGEAKLIYVVINCKLDNFEINKIIKHSIDILFFDISNFNNFIEIMCRYIQNFCEKEYSNTKISLEQRNVIQSFPFSLK